MKQTELNTMFNRGVDGANANLFEPVMWRLEFLIVNGFVNETDTITLKQLLKALKQVVKKQDKDIDRYINCKE